MFNKKEYLESIKEQIDQMIKLYEYCHFFDCLKENVNFADEISSALAKLYHIRTLMTPQTYELFYKLVKEFILSNGALFISLLLFSHPRKQSLVQFKNEEYRFGYSYQLEGKSVIDFIKSVNSQYEFLFLLKNEEGISKEVRDYWIENSLINKVIDVFYRMQDSNGCEISLQIMTIDGFTYDIENINESSTIKNFLRNILKENEELRDKINISFRKELGNYFSLI